MELFAEHLQTSTVNDKIFPNVVQGFMDTNPVVREHTIKVKQTFPDLYWINELFI